MVLMWLLILLKSSQAVAACSGTSGTILVPRYFLQKCFLGPDYMEAGWPGRQAGSIAEIRIR